ncbi:MAG: hypothetical protein QM767_20940 [Anaeromyxobacter sp.]
MPHRCALLALFLLPALAACKRAPPAPALDPARASAVLLDRFETVVHVRAGLVPPEQQQGEPVALDVLRDRLGELPWAVEAARGDARALLAASATVLLGARDFRAPGGERALGPVRSVRCFVLVLRPGEAVDPGGWGGAKRAPGAAALWRWAPSRELPGDPELAYFAAAGPGFLVVGNDAAETGATAAALAGAGPADALARLERLDLAGRSAWAYRNYRPAQDPAAAGVQLVPPWATALAFLPDEEKPLITVRLVGDAGAGEPGEELANLLRVPRLSLHAPGVWEARVSLGANGDEAAERLFRLEGLLGFATYL